MAASGRSPLLDSPYSQALLLVAPFLAVPACVSMTMNTDEKTRYDRQVRLWGKATQQRLQTTEVRVSGVTSAIAEVTKNLVLAGVRSVTVSDAATPDADDLKTNFLLQGSNTGGTRADTCVRRLQSLNPYVAVRLKHEENGEKTSLLTGVSFTVAIVRIRSVADAFREVCDLQNALTDLMVFVVDLGRMTMSVLLSKRRGISHEKQLELLFTKNTVFRPALFQRSLLLLRMAECPEDASFFERLTFARKIAVEYELCLVSREDVELAAGVSPLQLSGTAIESTVAGGVFAQLIINAVGLENNGSTDGDYSWTVCDSRSGINVQVGHLLGA